jgi:hypothetical protein
MTIRCFDRRAAEDDLRGHEPRSESMTARGRHYILRATIDAL